MEPVRVVSISAGSAAAKAGMEKLPTMTRASSREKSFFKIRNLPFF